MSLSEFVTYGWIGLSLGLLGYVAILVIALKSKR